MRWTRQPRAAGVPILRKPRRVGQPSSGRRSAATFVCAVILLSRLFSSGAPAEKHLSVYSLAANYSVPVVQREGRDYVGLLDVLEPLGRVSGKADGARWRLRYNNVESIFQVGKNRAQVV